ncbi:hypothetical protein [Pseudomonas eucalypticola]|uniref:Uncharacterized protein n=1 Tax=Pseudomonas eucalypticola TaxID=2599595 RepID=A0A7D5H071_9PSED|nr:hypothetical protein [Pseudomonas eucalypticola]QKZ04427.1 hypothetical protein HWQ56_11795 [Pseudomonas eucalypticola]
MASFAGVEAGDAPLERAEGRAVSFIFARGGDFRLLLQSRGGYKELKFSQYRSELVGGVDAHKNKDVVVEYYGEYIANCWEGQIQFCFAKCGDDARCKTERYNHEAQALRWFCVFNIIAFCFIFIWSAFFMEDS